MDLYVVLKVQSLRNLARWLSWLERRPVTAEVVGSSPRRSTQENVRPEDSFMNQLNLILIYLIRNDIIYTHGILAQLGEHLPYKQRVTGSSPVGPIFVPAWRNRQTHRT